MTGIELIVEECERQIGLESWTGPHDDMHTDGSLVWAAICYAASSLNEHVCRVVTGLPPLLTGLSERFALRDPWPWEAKWDKLNKLDRKRKLIIAGAFIAAELDRLLREEKP